MGIKLIWLGLALMFAVNEVLNLIGLSGSAVLSQVGGVVMVVGVIMVLFDK